MRKGAFGAYGDSQSQISLCVPAGPLLAAYGYICIITIHKTILQGPWVYWLLRIYTIRVCPKDQFSSGEAQINVIYWRQERA